METYEQCAFKGFSRTLDERYNYNPKKSCSMTSIEILKSNTILVRCTWVSSHEYVTVCCLFAIFLDTCETCSTQVKCWSIILYAPINLDNVTCTISNQDPRSSGNWFDKWGSWILFFISVFKPGSSNLV